MSTIPRLRIEMPCVRCGHIHYLDIETDLCRSCHDGLPDDGRSSARASGYWRAGTPATQIRRAS